MVIAHCSRRTWTTVTAKTQARPSKVQSRSSPFTNPPLPEALDSLLAEHAHLAHFFSITPASPSSTSFPMLLLLLLQSSALLSCAARALMLGALDTLTAHAFQAAARFMCSLYITGRFSLAIRLRKFVAAPERDNGGGLKAPLLHRLGAHPPSAADVAYSLHAAHTPPQRTDCRQQVHSSNCLFYPASQSRCLNV